jgi:hypothetical protein
VAETQEDTSQKHKIVAEAQKDTLLQQSFFKNPLSLSLWFICELDKVQTQNLITE